MDKREAVWRLYNSVTKKTYGNLSEREVGARLISIDQNKVAHWFVAEENDVDWTPLYKCIHRFKLPDFDRSIMPNKKLEKPSQEISQKQNAAKLPEVPAAPRTTSPPTLTHVSTRPPSKINSNADVEAIFQKIRIKLPERRRAKRHYEKLRVVVNMGLQSYETVTEDFSLSAIKVQQKFKIHINGDFQVTLYTEAGPLELQCSALVDSGTAGWNRLKISSGPHFSQYLKFLEKVVA